MNGILYIILAEISHYLKFERMHVIFRTNWFEANCSHSRLTDSLRIKITSRNPKMKLLIY